MLKSLPSAPQFEQWQQRTGELPPDFEAFSRNNFLPDPLTFMNGRAVGTPRTGLFSRQYVSRF